MRAEGYPNIIDTPLSARLRDETADVHEAAERSSFMGRLLDGDLGLDSYVQLLGQYLPVYRALESAADVHRHDPVAGPFARAELARCQAIEHDLATLAGPDWADHVVVTVATDQYVAQIEQACAWSGGFVAHHYVRYLGDLSGGQIIRRILRRRFDLVDDEGLTFYVFDDIDNGVQFKKWYREQLDRADWSAGEHDRVVAEARRAFELNLAVFTSLEPRPAR